MSKINYTPLVNFIKSEEAIPVVCFLSSLSLLPKRDLINYPVGSVFVSVVGSTFIGKIFGWFTPDKMKPHIAVGILGLTIVSACHRFLNRRNVSSKSSVDNGISIFSSPLINITYMTSESGTQTDVRFPWSRSSELNLNHVTDNSEDLMRVSYSIHRIIENTGLDLTTDEKLGRDVVIRLLDENKEKLNQAVRGLDVRKLICRLLSNKNADLESMKGLYIHGIDIGYVMIRTTSTDVSGDVVMSININALRSAH